MSLALGRKPRKLWTVGEVVRHTGLTRQTIHNYCTFGLLAEAERTPGGHRRFDDSVFARLARIGRLKQRGKRLQEIAALFEREQRRAQARDERTSGEGGDGAQTE